MPPEQKEGDQPFSLVGPESQPVEDRVEPGPGASEESGEEKPQGITLADLEKDDRFKEFLEQNLILGDKDAKPASILQLLKDASKFRAGGDRLLDLSSKIKEWTESGTPQGTNQILGRLDQMQELLSPEGTKEPGEKPLDLAELAKSEEWSQMDPEDRQNKLLEIMAGIQTQMQQGMTLPLQAIQYYQTQQLLERQADDDVKKVKEGIATLQKARPELAGEDMMDEIERRYYYYQNFAHAEAKKLIKEHNIPEARQRDVYLHFYELADKQYGLEACADEILGLTNQVNQRLLEKSKEAAKAPGLRRGAGPTSAPQKITGHPLGSDASHDELDRLIAEKGY